MNNIIVKKKMILLLLISILMTLNGHAEAKPESNNSPSMKLEMEWEVFLGGIGSEYPTGMIKTSDEGFAVAYNTEESFLYDSYLIKFNANGQQLWNTSFSEGMVGSSTIVQTNDNGYIVRCGIGEFGQDRDVLLLKFDSTGNLVWNNTFGGENSDWINSFSQTEDDGLIHAGSFNYSIPETGDFDMWMVKTNSQGVPEWNRTFGGEFPDVAHVVIQTLDRGYTIGGNKFFDGQLRGWLVKTDTTGKLEWNKTFNYEIGNWLIQNDDGSYVFGGEHYNGEKSNYYLLKANSNGNQLWYYDYDNMDIDELNYLIQTNDGGYLLAGCTGISYNTFHDLWFVKTDANGIHEWNVTYGDERLESIVQGVSVIQLSDGSLVCAGSYAADSHSNSDVWLFKAKVFEDEATGIPSFEYGVAILSISLVFVFARKRKTR